MNPLSDTVGPCCLCSWPHAGPEALKLLLWEIRTKRGKTLPLSGVGERCDGTMLCLLTLCYNTTTPSSSSSLLLLYSLFGVSHIIFFSYSSVLLCFLPLVPSLQDMVTKYQKKKNKTWEDKSLLSSPSFFSSCCLFILPWADRKSVV